MLHREARNCEPSRKGDACLPVRRIVAADSLRVGEVSSLESLESQQAMTIQLPAPAPAQDEMVENAFRGGTGGPGETRTRYSASPLRVRLRRGLQDALDAGCMSLAYLCMFSHVLCATLRNRYTRSSSSPSAMRGASCSLGVLVRGRRGKSLTAFRPMHSSVSTYRRI